MKYAAVFLLFGLTCAFYALTSSALGVRLIAASFALAFTGVGLAYAGTPPLKWTVKEEKLTTGDDHGSST